jgi:hypothetical protein
MKEDKENKIEKYIEIALFSGGILIFGFIAYVVILFGGAIIRSIF